MATQNYATFWERFLAIFIDGIVLSFANQMLKHMPMAGFLIGALYAILLWVNWNGQTLGKKVMKIKVVREDGKPLDYQTAIIRYLGYMLSGAVLLLGFLWVIWDSKKQGWHDKLAKTLVVKE